jgi:hypothetical protein
MAKFARGYIASGIIPPVTTELLSDAEKVEEGKLLRLQAFGARTTELDIYFLLYVVRVLGYRSGSPGSIPSTTRKKSSGSGTGCTQPREYN